MTRAVRIRLDSPPNTSSTGCTLPPPSIATPNRLRRSFSKPRYVAAGPGRARTSHIVGPERSISSVCAVFWIGVSTGACGVAVLVLVVCAVAGSVVDVEIEAEVELEVDGRA